MSPTTKPDPIYAATVRRLRVERGLSQEAVARRAGLTISTVARIERGVSNPKRATIRAIAAALGTTPRNLTREAKAEQVQPSLPPGGGE